MSRATKAYASAYQTERVQSAQMTVGEVREFEVDFNGALDGETITAAAWDMDPGSLLALADLSQAAGVVSVDVTAAYYGCTGMRVTATTSTGRKLIQRFRVDVQGVCLATTGLTWTA